MNLIKLFHQLTNKNKKYKTLDSLSDIYGKRVILRLDLNVPTRGNDIVDTFRIEQSYKTIDFLLNKGAIIVVISHLGKGEQSLDIVEKYLSKKYKTSFVKDPFGDNFSNQLKNANPENIFIIENIRFWKEEEDNDLEFAKKIASFGEIYVNEAFSVSHRKHASIYQVPKLMDSYAGFRFDEEITNLSKLFNAKKPFLLFLGGAKVKTKLPLLKRFLDIADKIFVGGVIANDFFKVLNYKVGKSNVSSEIVPEDISKNPKINLPFDVVVRSGDIRSNCMIEEVSDEDCIVDVGPETLKSYEEDVKKAATILWNGPLGYIEGGFDEGSKELSKMISHSKAFTVFGGGDSLSTVPSEIQKKFSFVSTGGGAMLDFLANKTLPGLEALE